MRILIYFVWLGLVACSTNPNKAIKVKTVLENSEAANFETQVGQNDKGEVVAVRKKKLVDQLKGLEMEVYQLESEIYGQETYGRKGMYGSLGECLDKGGELKRLPTKAILTKNEDKFSGKMVIDESKKLVSFSEEFLLDRIKRFEDYKEAYELQKDDYSEKLRICKKTGG